MIFKGHLTDIAYDFYLSVLSFYRKFYNYKLIKSNVFTVLTFTVPSFYGGLFT